MPYFADRKAHARPGSFDPHVYETSIGLPPVVAEVAQEFGAADAEEFSAFCSVFAKDVAERLHWDEADVCQAAEGLDAVLGLPKQATPPRFAFGARVPAGLAGLTAEELAAAKRRAG